MNTLDYYNNNANSYFDYTLSSDMSIAYEKFLKNLNTGDYILDFGCGSGRDSKYFIDNGYKVDSIDGSIELCHLASKYINQEVKCMKFDELSDIEKYDAIWACATLLHVPKKDFKDILIKLRNALKTNGVIYISLKNGTGEEEKNGRYFNYLTYDEFMSIIKSINLLVEIDFFETVSNINKDEDKVWNNFILRKVEV